MRRGPAALVVALLIGTGAAAQDDLINRRDQCSSWEYVPASEALNSSQSALLFCTENDRTWLALRVDCKPDDGRMVVHYRTGYAYTPPEPAPPAEPDNISDEEREDQEAARLVAAIPYDDGGVKVLRQDGDSPQEMVFLNFGSFGYTGVAEHSDDAWVFVEKQPLSPIFSHMITGNYADFKLLATGATERFPLRGSSKALRPLVETCRIAKRDYERAVRAAGQ